MGNLLRGGCHCGSLTVEFATDRQIGDIQVRACQCAFCRTHSALSISDPQGSVLFRVAAAERLSRYRFGLKLSDFLVCTRCGGYVGTFMPGESDTQGLAVVNLNCLAERDRFRPGEPMVYEGETTEQRLARRRERWMPARLEVQASAR